MMLVDMPRSADWSDHWAKRLAEARDLGLNLGPDISTKHPLIAYPAESSVAVEHSHPDQSLRELMGTPPLKPGWNARSDLFDEVTDYLLNHARETDSTLVSSAGYARAGDAYMSDVDHRAYRDHLFLFRPLSSREDVATALRWARPASVLAGLLASGSTDEDLSKIAFQCFICDAFRGDSLMFTGL